MKRSVLLTLAAFTLLANTNGQDLPNPAANLQTLPAGSFVIAMDNTNQSNGSNFNLKAYGLIVHLLNYNAKLKWVIKAGKSKDGIDFSSNAYNLEAVLTSVNAKITTVNGSTAATVNNANGLVVGMYVIYSGSGIQAGTTITAISGTNITLSLPATAAINNKSTDFTSVSYPAINRDFKAGPFVIFAQDTLGIRSLINGYCSQHGLTGSLKPSVYATTSATPNVDIRYNLTGFVPKAAILTDGGNESIHRDFMIAAGITTQNYREVTAVSLSDCYTFASEPHNDESGSALDATVSSIRNFVMGGRNFLAECRAVETYENNVNGRFHTTGGITTTNAGISTSINYPYADLGFYQFEGLYNGSAAGSLKNWSINGALAHPTAYVSATGTSANSDKQAASYTKLVNGTGGLVFYLGNHNFNDGNAQGINGIRMYLNAFMTPASLAGSDCDFPLLSVKLSNFSGFLGNNNKVNLDWTVAHNETAKEFEVERSTDGSNFTTAAVILSSDKSGDAGYQFAETMKAEKVFYRLKMTDNQGKVSYSKTLVFQFSSTVENNTVKVLNNAAADKLTLSFHSDASQPVYVRVLDLNGRQVMQQTISSYKGNNVSSLPLPSALTRGMYIVDLFDGVNHSTGKFIRN